MLTGVCTDCTNCTDCTDRTNIPKLKLYGRIVVPYGIYKYIYYSNWNLTKHPGAGGVYAYNYMSIFCSLCLW